MSYTWDVHVEHHTQTVIDFQWKQIDEERGIISFCNIYQRVVLVYEGKSKEIDGLYQLSFYFWKTLHIVIMGYGKTNNGKKIRVNEGSWFLNCKFSLHGITVFQMLSSF